MYKDEQSEDWEHWIKLDNDREEYCRIGIWRVLQLCREETEQYRFWLKFDLTYDEYLDEYLQDNLS